MARETAIVANYETITRSVEYYKSTVRTIEFAVNKWVLHKVQNFLGKNRKLAEAFKGPFVITKLFDNGTVQMKTKHGKHEQIVN
jgi:hypothetical protein